MSGKSGFFSSIKISKRLQILTALMSMILLIVGGMGAYLNSYLGSRSILLMDEVDQARQAQVTFKIQVQEWKDLLLRGQSIKDYNKYRDAFTKEAENVDVLLDGLAKKLGATNGRGARIEKLKSSLDTLDGKYLEALKKYRNDDPKTIFEVDSSVRGIDREPTQLMDDLVDSMKKDVGNEMNRLTRLFLMLAVGIMVGGIALGIFVGWIISRSVTRPVNLMSHMVHDLSEGEGDLTRRIDLDTRDELGEMATQLNKFLEQIHDIVKMIGENSLNVQRSSNQLTLTSESLSASSEQLSTQSQSISASTEQMNQNLQIVSNGVEEMSVSVREVAQRAAEGASTTAEANRIAERMNTEVKELGTNAREIGGVIDSIVSIASQTNLLALNASIEAAGAGDAGKGFAVVASEVKELARQAGESSEQIRERIEKVQTSVEHTVDSIGTITGVIGNVNEVNGAIASAVEEQSITAKELATNIMQLSTASQEIAKNIEGIFSASKLSARDAAETNKQAKQLQDLSAELLRAVNRFRVRKS